MSDKYNDVKDVPPMDHDDSKVATTEDAAAVAKALSAHPKEEPPMAEQGWQNKYRSRHSC